MKSDVDSTFVSKVSHSLDRLWTVHVIHFIVLGKNVRKVKELNILSLAYNDSEVQ